MCLSDQASREVCSLPPMASTITSACLRDLDGLGDLRAIFLRDRSAMTSSWFHDAADGDLAAFAVEHFDAVADAAP